MVPDCSFHSFLGWCLTLAAVCVQGVAAPMGWGRLWGCLPSSPLHPISSGILWSSLSFNTAWNHSELPLWRIPATGRGLLNGCLRRIQGRSVEGQGEVSCRPGTFWCHLLALSPPAPASEEGKPLEEHSLESIPWECPCVPVLLQPIGSDPAWPLAFLEEPFRTQELHSRLTLKFS